MPNERYILYTRQSHTKPSEQDSESLSLAFQERTLRLMVAQRGGAVIEPVIVDADEKGWDPHRPGLALLEERVTKEKPDVIAVYAVSRFARDNWLQEGIWRRIKKAAPDVRFESATEPHAEDDLVRGILGVVSQAERRRMGAFLSSSFRERARRGLHHGKVPFGFTKTEGGKLVIDEDAKPTVLDIVEKIEDGWSLWKVARYLNETHAGGRTWEPNVVRNTVKSPVIAGGVRTADVMTWDAHEAIIDRERWERLVAKLATRRVIRTKKAYSWLEGLIHCGCGAPMHLIYNNHSDRAPYGQFRCSADPAREQFQRPRNFPACEFRPRSIMQGKAEQLVTEAFVSAMEALLPAEDVYARRKASYHASSSDVAASRKRLQKDHARAIDERDRLLLLYRRGTLDVERWEREDAALGHQIARLAMELGDLPQEPQIVDIRKARAELTMQWDAISEVVTKRPEEIRGLLLALDVIVVRSLGGVELRFPDDYSDFFPTSVDEVV